MALALGKDKKVPQRKLDYGKKLYGLLNEYPKCLVVTVDNVGSKQISELRKDLRGRARFLFGKNTMVRKIIRNYIKDTGRKELYPLMDLVRGNSGFVFTKESVVKLRNEIQARKVQCPARAGSVAPVNVFVPPGPTGMEPTQTSFFQAMNIPTRINRGQIDIVNEVQVVTKGEKVGASEASLLIKLGIKPFFYGMEVQSVYDEGTAYDAAVLDITDDDLGAAFANGLRKVAALSITMKNPSVPQVPHGVLNGYKKCLALGLKLESYSWKELDHIKEVLKNPGAFAAAAAPAGGGGGAAAPAKEPTPSESEKSSAKGGGGGALFGGGGSDSDDDDSD